VTERNKKLQLVMGAWKQVQTGELSAEQALIRVVWAMLEPKERAILGFAVQRGTVMTPDVAERFGLSDTHASTTLKHLFDWGLLRRTEEITEEGRRFVYAPIKAVMDV